MIRRALLMILAACCLSRAEMRLFVVQEGTEQPVGESFQLGAVPTGGHLDTTFRVRNLTPAAAWFQSLTLAGAGFSFAVLPRLPVVVGSGEAVDFTVRFAPLDLVAYSAYLSVNGVTTVLRGSGRKPDTPPPTDPPKPPDPVQAEPPKPQIVLESTGLRGGQQAPVSIRFASASEIDAAGELTIEFKPAGPGKDDPGVLFPATGTRRIGFSVAKGAAAASFSGRASTEFQTGTTAGSIIFTAKLGPHREQFTATVPEGYVVIDSARAARSSSGVEVEVTGFDTSRSVSWLFFTFYDLAGGVVAPGAIQVDAAAAFRQYFESTELGSVFKLRAVFPVTGDAARIGFVEALLNNSLGSTQTRRLSIQ
ncbi:MAG: hypothetical protein IT159_16060 [Bryobacterales bacterium]|nr:hypothetical protein [Bryobacterales bacterium]